MQTQLIKITYKTKIKEMDNGRKYIDYKKTLTRADCESANHNYYNCDLFPQILARAYFKLIRTTRWVFIDELPKEITIVEGKFLSEIKIDLMA